MQASYNLFTACQFTSIKNYSCWPEMLVKSNGKKPKWPKKHQRMAAPVDHAPPVAESDVPVAPLIASTPVTPIVSISKKVRCFGCLLNQSSFIIQADVKHNPIYYIYEDWGVNNEGNVGNPGDKHYRCCHGKRKIFTISKAMNYSLHSATGTCHMHPFLTCPILLMVEIENNHPVL